MGIETKSALENKLCRVHWKNVRLAYCVKCQRAYIWKTEHCAECGVELVTKVERVQVTGR